MFFPPSSIWRDIILCRISEPTIAFYHGRIWWISLQIAGYVDDGWILIGVKNRVRIFYSNQLFGINEGIELIYRRLHRLTGCSRSWELYFFWFIPSIKRHVRTYHRYHSSVIIAEILIFLRSSRPRWCGVNIDRYYNMDYNRIHSHEHNPWIPWTYYQTFIITSLGHERSKGNRLLCLWNFFPPLSPR